MVIYIVILVVVTAVYFSAKYLMTKYQNKFFDIFDEPATKFKIRPIHFQGDIWVNSQKKGAEEAIVASLKNFRCIPVEFAPEDFYSTKPITVTLVDGAIELFFLLEGENKSQAYNTYVNFLLDDTLVSKDTSGNVIYYNSCAIDVFKEAAAISPDAKMNLITSLFENNKTFRKVFPDMTAVTSFLETLANQGDTTASKILEIIYREESYLTVNFDNSEPLRPKSE